MQEVGCVVQLHVRASLRRCKALKQQNSYSPWNFLSRINEPGYTQNMCGLLGGGRYIDTSVRSEPGIGRFFLKWSHGCWFFRDVFYICIYIYMQNPSFLPMSIKIQMISTNMEDEELIVRNLVANHMYDIFQNLMMQFQKIVSIDCLNINLKCGS